MPLVQPGRPRRDATPGTPPPEPGAPGPARPLLTGREHEWEGFGGRDAKRAPYRSDYEIPEPNVTWIEQIDEDDAEGRLAELYRRATDPASGRVDNILKCHSLHPEVLDAHLALYRASMQSSPSLPKREREMIAVTVSRLNGCHY